MVTALQAVKMYELLNKHFNDHNDAKAIVVSIEEIIDNKFNKENNRLATKQDISALKEETKKDISALKEETKKDINALKEDIYALKEEAKRDNFVLREDTKTAIFALREDVFALQTRMEQGFKDQLKWLIVLMVGWSSLMIAILKLT